MTYNNLEILNDAIRGGLISAEDAIGQLPMGLVSRIIVDEDGNFQELIVNPPAMDKIELNFEYTYFGPVREHNIFGEELFKL